MHSVNQSATATPAGRRAATAERITLCAQRLTDERGLDGFTMDDLATAAEVSRRTLFNYFPGKVDAVLGPVLDLDPDDVARFRAGGPEGDLVQDLRALVLPIVEYSVADREAAARSRRILRSEPRLIARVHAFYEDISAVVVGHIVAREDADLRRPPGAGRRRPARRGLRRRARGVPRRPAAPPVRAPLRRGAAHRPVPARLLSTTSHPPAAPTRPETPHPMATYLYRLGRTAFRRWPAFLAGWIVLFVAVGAFAAAFSQPTSDEVSIPGIPSEEAADLQAELFPDSKDAFDEATVNVVVAAPEGERLDQAPYAAAVDRPGGRPRRRPAGARPSCRPPRARPPSTR